MPTPRKNVTRWLLVALNLLVYVAVLLFWLDSRRTPDRDSEGAPTTELWGRGDTTGGLDDDLRCPGCNVLLISLDILRANNLPCYGYERDTAPNLCEMAQRGTLFENFIVHAYQTPISQMSILTSLYPSVSGYVSFASQIEPTTPYLPEVLQEQGYHNVAFGSSFEVMTDMSAQMVTRHEGLISIIPDKEGLNPGLSFGRGFDRFVFTGHRNLPTDALGWLRDAGDEAFFMWLPIGTLHWPYGMLGEPEEKRRFDPPGYDGMFKGVDRLGFRRFNSKVFENRYYHPDGNSDPLSTADVQYVISRYDFGIYYTDGFLGELFTLLHETGLVDNTLVILHGVHGEDLGEHGYYAHYDIFDTEVRTPLIIFNPRNGNHGQRISDQVRGIDLAPTILDLVGLETLPGALGESLVPAMQEGELRTARPAIMERIPLWEDMFRHLGSMPADYVERVTPILDERVYGDVGIRTDRWKLIHRRSRDIEAQVSWWSYVTGIPQEREEYELYDLDADPTELRNVYEQHPEDARRLREQLTAWEEATYREGLHDLSDGRPR